MVNKYLTSSTKDLPVTQILKFSHLYQYNTLHVIFSPNRVG